MMEDSDPAIERLVYVVDDDDALRDMLSSFLRDEGFRVLEGASGNEVLSTVQREGPDVVLMDLRMPDQSGMEVLEGLRSHVPEIPVLIMTGYASSSAAIQATQQGAYDYITKPFELADLLHRLQRALEHGDLAKRVRETKQSGDREVRDKFVGTTPAMQEIFKTIGRIAGSNSTVMIFGESGTGKEMAAHAIHYNSPRRAAPFVKVSCASFVETLLESELFGHEKGAFTHAIAQRKGRFEQANKGTIFLDEIGEMSLNMQKKLLRVLQEREFERVGGSITMKVDVRVLAATNRDLAREVAEGRFREDLFYRLNVITLTMPPLRERRDDIPLLVEHFLDKHPYGPARQVARISTEAMDMLMQHNWPGNVRDLENSIERAVVLSHGDVIMPEHLSFTSPVGPLYFDVAQRVATSVPLSVMIEELERSAIEEAMRQCHNSLDKAAERLGLELETLQEKLVGHLAGSWR